EENAQCQRGEKRGRKRQKNRPRLTRPDLLPLLPSPHRCADRGGEQGAEEDKAPDSAEVPRIGSIEHKEGQRPRAGEKAGDEAGGAREALIWGRSSHERENDSQRRGRWAEIHVIPSKNTFAPKSK